MAVTMADITVGMILGTIRGIIVAGIHLGTTEVGTRLGITEVIMAMADIMAVAIIVVITTAITMEYIMAQTVTVQAEVQEFIEQVLHAEVPHSEVREGVHAQAMYIADVRLLRAVHQRTADPHQPEIHPVRA